MADFLAEQETQPTRYKTIRFTNSLELDEGAKLTNDSQLVEFATRTVPEGFKVYVDIDIICRVVKKST